MKRVLTIASLAFIIILAGSWRNKTSAQVNVDISYQTFYDELSPYGEWIDYPEYGYVWVPSESEGFMPYETNGHWVWSDEYEWMWVSDYSWGWAPFHYGRWFDDPYYGWMWVPGYEWSPAWVAWRDGGDYYGWAPLRPGFNISIGFSTYSPPVNYWCFAPRSYIASPRIWDYCVDRSRNVTIINNTTIINNYNRRSNIFVSGGPRRMDAERYAGRINPVRFREASGPGRAQFRGNEVSVYRPRVEQNNNRRFTPRNFEQYDRSRGQNNNGFVRRGNDNSQRNGNNLPNRDNNRIERRNDNAQPGNNNNNDHPERRNIFDRPNNQQRNNDNRNMDRRGGFDRNNNQPSNDNRQNGRNFETPVQPQSNPSQPNQREQRPDIFQRRNNDQPFQNRRDMRNDNRAERPQQMERQQQPQPQPRQFENRQFDRRQSSPQPERQPQSQPQQRQFEQRQSSPQPDRQPRQFENRGGGNNQQRGGNDNNGRGHGRRF